MLLFETLIPLQGVDVSITGVRLFLLCHLDWASIVDGTGSNSRTFYVHYSIFERVSRSEYGGHQGAIGLGRGHGKVLQGHG